MRRIMLLFLYKNIHYSTAVLPFVVASKTSCGSCSFCCCDLRRFHRIAWDMRVSQPPAVLVAPQHQGQGVVPGTSVSPNALCSPWWQGLCNVVHLRGSDSLLSAQTLTPYNRFMLGAQGLPLRCSEPGESAS